LPNGFENARLGKVTEDMESIPCDLCGGASASFVTRQKDVFHRTTDEYFSIVRCEQCGLCFTNPRPPVQEMARHYPADYSFHERAPRSKVLARRILDRVANSPLANLFAWCPPISRQLAVRIKPSVADPVMAAFRAGLTDGLLDIGSGSGDHANIWGHSGGVKAYRRLMPVAAIDTSEVARTHLRAFDIETWPDIESVPEGRTWSIIRMNWSLEHVHRPSSYFDFISKHLRLDGRAMICVPNYDGLLYRLAPDCVEVPVHLYHFTPRHIEMYALRFGLRMQQLVTFSYPASFFLAVDAGLLPSLFGSNRGVREARLFNQVLSRFDSAGYGNDIVAVLERTESQ
jgi:SAM-dependent methyltransferase